MNLLIVKLFIISSEYLHKIEFDQENIRQENQGR